jgi:branched-chain amino acid transport system permease protein
VRLGRLRAADQTRAALIAIVTTLALIGSSYLLGPYTLHVLTSSAYYAILAASWNLLAGYMSRFSLAQQSFAAIGAYSTGMLILYFHVPIWIGIISATAVATVVGAVVGLLVLRMQAAYLALATWSFAATLQILLTAGYEVTRGQLGLAVPSLFGNLDPASYYRVFVVLAAICLLLMYFIVHSPVGLFMRSIKDDELRSATLGVDTTKWKIAIFALTSGLSGLAGAFYAHYIVVLSPVIADFSEMGKIIAMTVMGGLGTFMGPIIGAPLIQFLLTYFQQYAQWAIVMYALVVIVVIRLYRTGLVGLVAAVVQWARRLIRRGSPPAPSDNAVRS